MLSSTGQSSPQGAQHRSRRYSAVHAYGLRQHQQEPGNYTCTYYWQTNGQDSVWGIIDAALGTPKWQSGLQAALDDAVSMAH